MKKLAVVLVITALVGSAQAYNIKYSYPGKNSSTEYYGACNNGEQLLVVEHNDGSYSFEGPAGSGQIKDSGALDKAAAAACGE